MSVPYMDKFYHSLAMLYDLQITITNSFICSECGIHTAYRLFDTYMDKWESFPMFHTIACPYFDNSPRRYAILGFI
jgi:hypothetical protein